MISGRLTMRARIVRAIEAGDDAWGNPLPPVLATVAEASPCFVYSNTARELVDGQKTAQVEELRAMFSLAADVRPEDEIAQVTDRAGRVLHGRLRIEGPAQRKHTHQEVSLRRVV